LDSETPIYNGMTHIHEWDWPPRRRRRYRAYRNVNAYQPTGWNSPWARKAISIYCRVTITAIKMVIAVPLTIALIGSIWLLWVLIRLYL
jgi:hypothetical protein